MTRMWLGVDPAAMCTEHIKRELHEIRQLCDVARGESEIEPDVGIKKLAGHAARGQIDTRYIDSRWTLLWQELRERDESYVQQAVPDYPDIAPEFRGWGVGVPRANRARLAGKCNKCAVVP